MLLDSMKSYLQLFKKKLDLQLNNIEFS